ncbi:hypothetical protein AYI69_g8343 [Smittium culicis]|uniref:Aspartic peptidase DDI1-type domain-containing protein n=1 Tax=Smittium culicis TaxID=133412 RepID=A0A1R1XKC4_9FUNG|nr:hypothetical protein AYI69_g8343 [Smittium culicis]
MSYLEGLQINLSNPKQLSYIICNLTDQSLPLFVDVGSTYCDISKNLLNVLDIPYAKKEELVTSVGGDALSVIETPTLNIMFEDTYVNFNFQVLEICAVHLKLGLDVCQILGIIINYRNETLSMSPNNKNIELQPFSRERVLKLDLDEHNNFVEDSELDYIEDDNELLENDVFLVIDRSGIIGAGELP